MGPPQTSRVADRVRYSRGREQSDANWGTLCISYYVPWYLTVPYLATPYFIVYRTTYCILRWPGYWYWLRFSCVPDLLAFCFPTWCNALLKAPWVGHTSPHVMNGVATWPRPSLHTIRPGLTVWTCLGGPRRAAHNDGRGIGTPSSLIGAFHSADRGPPSSHAHISSLTASSSSMMPVGPAAVRSVPVSHLVCTAPAFVTRKLSKFQRIGGPTPGGGWQNLQENLHEPAMKSAIGHGSAELVGATVQGCRQGKCAHLSSFHILLLQPKRRNWYPRQRNQFPALLART